MTELTDIEAHRHALTGHCYRMGSAFDADDAVQETLIRAWRSRDQFAGRASIKTWLYRIATNVCLDELKDRGRRGRPIEEGYLLRDRHRWLQSGKDRLARKSQLELPKTPLLNSVR